MSAIDVEEKNFSIRGKISFIHVLIFFFILIPSQLLAQGGNIKIGNLKVVPGVTGQAIYDDNIYMKNGTTTGKTDAYTKVSDWIYHVKPSLLLDYTLPERGFLKLGYMGDWAFYNDNTNNNWKTNKGHLDFDYKAPGGLILGINNIYSASEDPYGSPSQYGVGRVTARWDDDLKSKIGFRFSEKFKTLLYYNYYKQDYVNTADDSQDYYDSEFGVGLEAKFLPKTWSFVRYHYGTRTFDANNASLPDMYKANSKWHKASTGLTWDPLAKLSGELNVGYQWKTYDNEFYAAGAKRDTSKDTWVAATSISYKPLDTTTISLNIARAMRDTSSNGREYFVDTSTGLTLQQRILRKFVLSLGGMYSRNEYNTPNTTGNTTETRNDNNYQANVGLDYNMREWFTVSIGYNYKEKSSSDSINDYKDNQFVTSVKILY